MNGKKIIVVFGATGAQGGGLVRAILNDAQSQFSVRAVTRDANSEKARDLARLGAEIVTADIDDAKSIERALENAYGAFFVTFFWAHFSPEREMAEARNFAAASKKVGLIHAVWSTLEDTRQWIPITDERMPTISDHYKVPHFDGKGASDKYFSEAGVPTTFLLTSFFWENLIHFGMGPKKSADGKLVLTFPMGDKKLSGIGVEDVGKCAYGIFKKGPELSGKTVGIAGEHIECQKMAKLLTRRLGQEVTYQSVSPATYRAFGFPGAEDLGNMFQFYQEFNEPFMRSRDIAQAREMNPALQDFEQWLIENGPRIPIE